MKKSALGEHRLDSRRRQRIGARRVVARESRRTAARSVARISGMTFDLSPADAGAAENSNIRARTENIRANGPAMAASLRWAWRSNERRGRKFHARGPKVTFRADARVGPSTCSRRFASRRLFTTIWRRHTRRRIVHSRHENKILRHRLGDQHPVERVAVGTRQGSRDLAMSNADRQPDEPVIDDRPFEIGDNGGDAGQFADAMFRRYFPGGRRADENARCAFVRYRRSSRRRTAPRRRRATRESAFVSSNSRKSRPPRRQLLLRQGLEEFGSDADDSAQRPKPALWRARLQGHELGDRLLAARQDNLLAGFDAREKLRQRRLRRVDVTVFMAPLLAK